MFRCGICGNNSRPVQYFSEKTIDDKGNEHTVSRRVAAEKPERYVLARREKAYPKRENAMKPRPDQRESRKVNRAGFICDPGGNGWEITSEVLAHTTCVPSVAQ